MINNPFIAKESVEEALAEISRDRSSSRVNIFLKKTLAVHFTRTLLFLTQMI